MVDEVQSAWVQRVLGIAAAADAGAEDEEIDPAVERGEIADLGLDVGDMWTGAIEAFESATEEANGQIRALQAALRETDDPDLHDIADSGLNALTGNTRVPLMAAIREGGGGAVPQLKAAAPKILKAVDAFRAQLASPQVKAVDDNPFGVEVTFEQTFADALDQLAYAAKLAA